MGQKKGSRRARAERAVTAGLAVHVHGGDRDLDRLGLRGDGRRGVLKHTHREND